VKNDEYGIMTITGGVFVSTSKFAVNSWNELTILGGAFTSEAAAPLVCGSTPGDGGHCQLNIRGGTFRGATGIVSDCSEGQSQPDYVAPDWNVTAGAYMPAIEEKFLGEGVELIVNPDGTTSVVTDSTRNWKVERGVNSAGFLGVAGAVFKKDVLEYKQGGIDVPAYDFTPIAVIGASAVGGITAYYDPVLKKIILYRGNTEASGSILDVTLAIIGH